MYCCSLNQVLSIITFVGYQTNLVQSKLCKIMETQQTLILSEVQPQNRESEKKQKQESLTVMQATMSPLAADSFSQISINQNVNESIMSSVQQHSSQLTILQSSIDKSQIVQKPQIASKKQFPLNVYFQKQASYNSQCLKHALNNYFGYCKFKTEHLVQICKKLSNNWINPHKHFLGGDYDVNVLFFCLDSNDKKYRWHDKRISFNGKQIVQQELVQGFFINTSSQGNSTFKKWLGFSARHWLCMKIIQNYFVKFDSGKDNFQIFGKGQAQRQLNQYIANNDQVIQIYR